MSVRHAVIRVNDISVRPSGSDTRREPRDFRGLWKDDSVSVDGEFFDLTHADIGLRPAGRSPPVYVASATFDPRYGFSRQIRSRISDCDNSWFSIGMSPEIHVHHRGRIDLLGIAASVYRNGLSTGLLVALDQYSWWQTSLATPDIDN